MDEPLATTCPVTDSAAWLDALHRETQNTLQSAQTIKSSHRRAIRQLQHARTRATGITVTDLLADRDGRLYEENE